MFWLLKLRDGIERLAIRIAQEMRKINTRLDDIEDRLNRLEND